MLIRAKVILRAYLTPTSRFLFAEKEKSIPLLTEIIR